ncbi:unnamed protein product [Lathyrus sativus]|nr:unnamed protein product [Lathyrus sativus]
MFEAFDYMFVAARSKPIVKILEEIRVYLMQIWESNRKKIAKYEGIILPNIKKRMERESQKTNHWIRTSEYDYEVRNISLNGEKYVINLYKKECSCKIWMLTGLVCCHAMSCIKDQHLEIDDFVPDCYKKEQYSYCYAPIIYPFNRKALWEKTSVVDLQPPPIKRQPRMTKKKRNREAGEMMRDETHIKRARHGIKCSRCHKDGHNKATCKQPQPQAPPSQVQQATTQPPPTNVSSQVQEATTQPPPLVVTSQLPLPVVTSHTPPPIVTSQPPPKTTKNLHKGGKPVSSQP